MRTTGKLVCLILNFGIAGARAVGWAQSVGSFLHGNRVRKIPPDESSRPSLRGSQEKFSRAQATIYAGLWGVESEI